MDKQMIEEMEKDIAVRMAMAKGIVGSMNNGVEGWLASYLHDLGYRKIPENAVVLTEYESFGDIEDLLTEFDEMGFEPTTLHPYSYAYANSWKLRLAWAIGQLRKETVDKFAERLKEKAWAFNTDENGNIWDYNIMKSSIDEIAKEITEGKV